ncbi:MAG: FxsA family protein [Nitrospira sp.]|nr:FxsA family protein [bacterium]MBL7049610.1 FxsA family protein [Nitrospira sp.]
MLFKLFFLFAVIPVIELAILIEIGSYIGVLPTVIVVIVTAMIGASMVRSEGLYVLSRLQRDMNNGIFPAEELIDGAMILVAGALLLTPGFFTDIIGFLMVFPVPRKFIKKFGKDYIEKKINSNEITIK